MAKQSSSDEELHLHDAMEKLVRSFDEVADRNSLLHSKELGDIIAILRESKSKEEQSVPNLPDDKKADLAALLPRIDEVLQQCKASPPPPPPPPKKKLPLPCPSVSDCNPFKSRSSQQAGKLQGEDGGAGVPSTLSQSLDKLRQEAEAIFPGDAAAAAGAGKDQEEKVILYEWTTSYVDEGKIFGWGEEAGEVVDALVGPRPPADDKDDAPPPPPPPAGEGSKVDDEKAVFRTAAIVGIHGCGKTALARKVFVHERVKDAFPLRLWVCVGPPDHEDRPGLLYRMLDNLGLDTAKVEDIVNNSKAVKDSTDKETSKIGVLLFILHVTLYKTGYLIVFDDIRSHGSTDGWYNNLKLEPPRPKAGEWSERLAYGLPKVRNSAVLITCRHEDDARAMVRTGGVFRPPELAVEDGWKLFEREYKEAKKENGQDKLYDDLVKMKKQIVDKCLGLPVAIIQAARGLANYEPETETETAVPSKTEAAADAEAEAHGKDD